MPKGATTFPRCDSGGSRVTVELPGFKRILNSHVVAALGDRLQLDFVLEVGAARRIGDGVGRRYRYFR